MSYRDMIDVLEQCITDKIPEAEAKAVLGAISKAKDLDPNICINLESTIVENTGRFFDPECQTVRLCNGGHCHYLPKQDKLTESEGGPARV
ncbi:unnamed protein product [marine sediment metagenome]|uniref:Uncharacterized protein n=1 Tax=marine sediment metagenome TaxID=412755 RepID=X1CPJ9_9ZZZZ